MSVYQVSGLTFVIPGDGSEHSEFITIDASINQITGGMGVNTVRVMNTSSANIAVVAWAPADLTYEFTNVTYTTDSAYGANAAINVTATIDGYVVTITNGGVDYVVAETLTVSGAELGGDTPANDLVASVSAISDTGAITGLTLAGTSAWPQSSTGEVYLLPNSQELIQVTNTPSIGVNFVGSCADGNIYITPVTIVG